MISAQTRSVCREGKPVSTFPDHALAADIDAKATAAESHADGRSGCWLFTGGGFSGRAPGTTRPILLVPVRRAIFGFLLRSGRLRPIGAFIARRERNAEILAELRQNSPFVRQKSTGASA